MARRHHHHHHHPDLDSPFWWLVFLVKLGVWAVLAGVWIAWALIVLPVAGVAKLAHNDGLAQGAIRSLGWKFN